jgi:hypothetical protein
VRAPDRKSHADATGSARVGESRMRRAVGRIGPRNADPNAKIASTTAMDTPARYPTRVANGAERKKSERGRS